MAHKIDPRHLGTTIRFFLIAETIINLLEGFLSLFAPNRFLRMVLAEGTSITLAHETLLQCSALPLTFFITPLAGVCAANSPTTIKSRKLLYLGYAIVEAAGISFFWWLIVTGPEYSEFDPDSSRFIAKQLILPFFGRLIPLWKTKYFRRYVLVDDGRKKSE